MSYKLLKSMQIIELSGIDGTTLATSTLGTTEAAGRFIPLQANVQLISTSDFVLVGSLSIGTNGSVDDILPITPLTSLNAANLILTLPLISVISSVAPSTTISVKITTAATATTYVLKVGLIGYYS